MPDPTPSPPVPPPPGGSLGPDAPQGGAESPPPGYAPPPQPGYGQQPQPGYGGPGYGAPPPGYGVQPPGYGMPPGYGGGYPTYGQPKGGIPTWVKILGGCTGVAVVAIIIVIFLGIRAYSNTPLAQFPHYPGSTATSINLSATSSGTSDQMTLNAPNTTVDQVRVYYATALNTKGWTNDGFDSTAGIIAFHRSAYPSEKGTAQLSQQGSATLIVVVYNY